MKKFIVDKIKYTINERKKLIFSCFLVFLIAFIYASFFVDKTMLPTEGWYTYYAYIMNQKGAIPYIDFELLFPPLYTYMIAFFTNIFGYDIISLRFLGVLIYSFTGVFACLIFEKLTNNKLLGIVGGVLTIAVLQSERVQLFYDYIRVMDFFVYASIYFFIRYFHNNKISKNRININVLLGTILAVLASMFKQSSGLIYLIFCLIFFLFMAIFDSSKKGMLYQFWMMLLIVVIMYGIMFIFLINQGSFINYIRYNFVSSVGAKGAGSFLNLIFSFADRLREYLGFGVLFVIALSLLLILELFLNKDFPMKKGRIPKKNLNYGYLGVIVSLFLSSVLPFIWDGYALLMSKFMNQIAMYSLFLFSTLFFAITSVYVIISRFRSPIKWKEQYKYYFLSGVIFVLGYAVEMSGGLALSQIALAFSFVPFLLIKMAKFRGREIFVAVMIFNMIFQIGVSFGYKVVYTYDWWKLNGGSYFEQVSTSDVPIFKGLKMKDSYAKMYNEVYGLINKYTEEDDEIFVFPHMPILYVATGRDRATNTAIQWFDVATDEAIIEDIEVIKEKKPKAIVMMTIPLFTMDFHENTFRDGYRSGLHEMQDFLERFVVEEKYILYSKNTVCNYYNVSLWILE